MKIGVNTRLLLPGTLEGIGRFSNEVLKRMVEGHPEDEFYFFFDRACEEKFIFGPNVTAVNVAPQSRHPVLWYWWFEKSISKAIFQYKIEVFFSPELYCCLSTEVPTLMIAHDVAHAHYPHHIPYAHQKYLKYFVPRFLQRAEKIGAVSNATISDLKDKFHIAPDKIFLSYNGPTPGFVSLDQDQKDEVRNTISEGHSYFIYLGSMHPRKNIEGLIEAYNIFRTNNPELLHRLVLVGRMAWKHNSIKKAYDDSPYKEDIKVLGEIVDAATILGAAEALVYVSLLEGFGIPIIEAMACEVPVITSNISSMPEVAGEGAILVDPTDTIAIAEALKKVLNPEIRENIISKGRSQLKKFSWPETSEIIYEELKILKERNNTNN